MELHVSPLGDHALLAQADGPLSVQTQARIWALADALRPASGIDETVLGMTNLTVLFNPEVWTPEALAQRLQAHWRDLPEWRQAGRTIEVPVLYGGDQGPDLAAVAAHAGLSPAEVVARHSGAAYTVYALGSSPGFAYLGGLPESLFMPRRQVPVLRAEARSVMIGGMQTGVTTAAGPTGWHVIGRSTLSLFDMHEDPPARLSPGDTVRFRCEALLS